MGWTLAYGVFGAAMLLASNARGCHRCVGYGAAAMVSWLVTALAIGLAEARFGKAAGAAWALVGIIPTDAAIGLLVAAAYSRHRDEKTEVILGLIISEMIWHLACYFAGIWGDGVQYFGMNVVWVAWVWVAGGNNAQAIVNDWRHWSFGRPHIPDAGP